MKVMTAAQSALDMIAREILKQAECPAGWVQVQQDEDLGWVVGIILGMTLEETGDAESGPSLSMYPHRYAFLHYVGGTGWVLDVHDNTDLPDWHQESESKRLVLRDLDSPSWTPRGLAEYVLDLFHALGITLGKEERTC